MQYRSRLAMLAIFVMLGAFVMALQCQAAAPPICPHIIYWNNDHTTWAQGAPWIKVIMYSDIVPAKNAGAKVFYRPYEVPGNDDGGCSDGAAMATAVLNILNQVPRDKWPDAIGYRNEFNNENTTTPVQFIPYYDTLRAGGYTGMIIYGSYGVGWPALDDWGLPAVQAAVNKSDGIETHEYFDLTIAWYDGYLCRRHVTAMNQWPYLQNKPWFIGEFGSDRVSQVEDTCLRRGWRATGTGSCSSPKLSETAMINQCTIYRNGCADQVRAVFLFQQGSGGWWDFDVIGTSVATWMQSTWIVRGTIAGNVKDGSGNNLSGATVSTTTGGYTTTTNSSGNYAIGDVDAGTYSVVASKAGYSTVTQTGKTVTAGQTTTCNYTLTAVPPGTIVGNVKNNSGVNLSGATVSTTTGGYTTTTNSSGNYTLSNVAVGTYNVVASKSGYVNQTQSNKTVSSGATTTVNFTLGTQPFSGLANKNFEGGFYNDPDGDHAVANSWTKFVLSGSPKYNGPWLANWHSGNYGQQFYEASWIAGIRQQATGCIIGNNYTASVWVKGSDSDIRFWIGIDPAGGTDANSANVQWSSEYVATSSWAQISKQVAATSSTITVFIKARNVFGNNKYAYIDDADLVDNGGSSTGTITGNVKDGAGANVSGATVSTTSGGYTTTSDSSGNYTLAGVAPATYSVVASKTGYNSQTQTGTTVTANQTTTCNFTITRQTGTISGNVKNSSAQNLSGATVSTTTGGYTATTDANGNYTMANVATGTYDVVASKSGYNNQTQTGKTVTNGATTTVSFTLSPTGGSIASESFDTLPSWTSYYDATWGSAATWSSVAGGQSGNFMQCSRSSGGSSSKVKVYTVPTNTNITVSAYMKCPNFGSSYWMEFACKLGNYSAQDFDQNSGTWTMIKKFADNGTNGNGNTWVQYSSNTINTGSNTQISIGYKLGSSGSGPTVGWDTFVIQ